MTKASRTLAFLALAFAAFATAPATAVDSQVVLNRYSAKLLSIEEPKTLIFTYTVSQAGPRDIEQTHRIYRSGELVRDETIAVDGQRPPSKLIRISRYRNRYTLENLAPRETQYALLFERSIRSGSELGYVYRAVPLAPTGAFVVDGVTIDGLTFLPLEIRFHTSRGTTKGSGSLAFGSAGRYWVPTVASVQATIAGKPARERITFSAYQFPASLPKSTFLSPKPLPELALPAF